MDRQHLGAVSCADSQNSLKDPSLRFNGSVEPWASIKPYLSNKLRKTCQRRKLLNLMLTFGHDLRVQPQSWTNPDTSFCQFLIVSPCQRCGRDGKDVCFVSFARAKCGNMIWIEVQVAMEVNVAGHCYLSSSLRLSRCATSCIPFIYIWAYAFHSPLNSESGPDE